MGVLASLLSNLRADTHIHTHNYKIKMKTRKYSWLCCILSTCCPWYT